MAEVGYETVYTIDDWYDGARAGIADLEGKPHYYECRWDDAQDDWSEIYLLKPIDDETFRLALEDWQIWKRWEVAFNEGRATLETHPTLPEDRARHDELESILGPKLCIDTEAPIKAKGDFSYGEPTLVKWTIMP
jgi:hypothetical protein